MKEVEKQARWLLEELPELDKCGHILLGAFGVAAYLAIRRSAKEDMVRLSEPELGDGEADVRLIVRYGGRRFERAYKVIPEETDLTNRRFNSTFMAQVHIAISVLEQQFRDEVMGLVK